MLIAAAGWYGVDVTYYATIGLPDSTSRLYQEHSSSEQVRDAVIDAGRLPDLLFLKFYW